MTDYEFIIENMRFSFSNLNSFCNCKRFWKLKYIEGESGENNVYAQFGSFCHKILEMFYKGELRRDELAMYYTDKFDEEIDDGIFEGKLFGDGLSYFENADLSLNGWEILGVEKECNFKIGRVPFVGYIDLILADKDGNIMLKDHKSSAYPVGKKGDILKSNEAQHLEHQRQQYLYSKFIFDEYGKYPAKIGWNYFRAQKELIEDFSIVQYEKSLKWASEIIKKIKNETSFSADGGYFFCNNLCEFRGGSCSWL